MLDSTRYRQRLVTTREYLRSYDDRLSAPLLDDWIIDLDRCSPNADLLAQVNQTQNRTGGMGSLGGILEVRRRTAEIEFTL